MQRFFINLINMANLHLATNKHDLNTCHLSGEMWIHQVGALRWSHPVQRVFFAFIYYIYIFFSLFFKFFFALVEFVCHLYSFVGKQEIGCLVSFLFDSRTITSRTATSTKTVTKTATTTRSTTTSPEAELFVETFM